MRPVVRLAPALLLAVLVCVLRAPPAAGQAVGLEFQVNAYTTGGQQDPRLAIDMDGNFVVVWYGNGDCSTLGVFGQRFDSAGAPLGTEFRVNTYTTNSQIYPSVARDSAGHFVVVWQSFTQVGLSADIFGQRFDSGGAPLGTEFQVNTFTQGMQAHPSVASDSDGNFVVVWDSFAQDYSNFGVFGQRFGSAGAPLGDEFRVNTYTSNSQSLPSVASDSGGKFVVVWQSYGLDGSSGGIFGQRYDSAGASLGMEFRVNTYTTNSQSGPSVATDSGGNFVVVWQSFLEDGPGYGVDVFGQRYSSAGTPLGAEFRANAYLIFDQGSSSVASNSNGNFVVVWNSSNQDSSSDGVFGQRFSSTGVPLGAEFSVNTYTTNGQRSPSVASTSDGRLVVVWQGYGQDGSSEGVFGQRFCSALNSVTINVSGTTTVCTTSAGGLATVTDEGGSLLTHQWGYRVMPGSIFTSAIGGQTGTSYLIDGSDFLEGPGAYYLVCATFPECGTVTFSNEIMVVVNPDPTAPGVTPPPDLTMTQTLCM